MPRTRKKVKAAAPASSAPKAKAKETSTAAQPARMAMTCFTRTHRRRWRGHCTRGDLGADELFRTLAVIVEDVHLPGAGHAVEDVVLVAIIQKFGNLVDRPSALAAREWLRTVPLERTRRRGREASSDLGSGTKCDTDSDSETDTGSDPETDPETDSDTSSDSASWTVTGSAVPPSPCDCSTAVRPRSCRSARRQRRIDSGSSPSLQAWCSRRAKR